MRNGIPQSILAAHRLETLDEHLNVFIFQCSGRRLDKLDIVSGIGKPLLDLAKSPQNNLILEIIGVAVVAILREAIDQDENNKGNGIEWSSSVVVPIGVLILQRGNLEIRLAIETWSVRESLFVFLIIIIIIIIDSADAL